MQLYFVCVFVEDILNSVSVLFQHCFVREQGYKNAANEMFEQNDLSI